MVAGLSSQEAAALYFNAVARDNGQTFRVEQQAAYGQQGTDLVVRVDGLLVRVEVKGVTGFAKPVPIFDKSVRRRNVPREVEDVTAAYTESLSFGGAKLKTVMASRGYPRNFLGVIDFFRDFSDPAVGLAEDPNSAASGKLPRELFTRDQFVCRRARTILIDGLRRSQDSYFVVHDKKDDEIEVYYTGFGQNVLQAPDFPDLQEIALDTYGGASRGATRVAFKARFA